MPTEKRRVDVFTAGCPLCEEAVDLVQSLVCPSCDIRVYDLRAGCDTNECREKLRDYGITAVPAIAVGGMVLDCCRQGPLSAHTLRAAGIGQP